jgi:hypothetical protein
MLDFEFLRREEVKGFSFLFFFCMNVSEYKKKTMRLDAFLCCCCMIGGTRRTGMYR